VSEEINLLIDFNKKFKDLANEVINKTEKFNVPFLDESLREFLSNLIALSIHKGFVLGVNTNVAVAKVILKQLEKRGKK